jgi:hypothetical protein
MFATIRSADSSPGARPLFDQREHSLLVEVSVAQIRLFPQLDLETSCSLGVLDVDTDGAKPFAVVELLARTDDVKRLLSALQSFPNERQQNSVFFTGW